MTFVGFERACVVLARVVIGLDGRVAGPVRCPRCERDLPADAFHADPSRATGRCGICADCVSLKDGARWATLPPEKRTKAAAIDPPHNDHNSRFYHTRRRLRHAHKRDRIVRAAGAAGREALGNLARGLAIDGSARGIRSLAL